MTMRIGVVVATHPEDHSVDLVMADNGERVVGAQVMTGNGSTRTGTVDMPAVPDKANKWDISQRTGQDQIAIVAYISRQPVVLGFVYPQINQILSDDPKRLIGRHQSDVQWSIDGDGNIQLQHPGGTYIRIGETPDAESAVNADGNAAVDRNTGRQVNVRIGLAGGAAELTMTPDGNVTLNMMGNLAIAAQGNVAIGAGGSLTLSSGGDMTLDVGGSLSADASGVASISGATVQLN